MLIGGEKDSPASVRRRRVVSNSATRKGYGPTTRPAGARGVLAVHVDAAAVASNAVLGLIIGYRAVGHRLGIAGARQEKVDAASGLEEGSGEISAVIETILNRNSGEAHGKTIVSPRLIDAKHLTIAAGVGVARADHRRVISRDDYAAIDVQVAGCRRVFVPAAAYDR